MNFKWKRVFRAVCLDEFSFSVSTYKFQIIPSNSAAIPSNSSWTINTLFSTSFRILLSSSFFVLFPIKLLSH